MIRKRKRYEGKERRKGDQNTEERRVGRDKVKNGRVSLFFFPALNTLVTNEGKSWDLKMTETFNICMLVEDLFMENGIKCQET